MSPSPARTALPQRVAAVILEGAARTLATQGPSASMTDVAVGAGVARATVYRYFPSRQTLLQELALMALRETEGRLSSSRLDEISVPEGLTRVVRALVDVGDPFIVLARERVRPDDFERTVSTPVAKLLERGQKGGEIRDDLPVRWLTETLLGVVVSVLTASPERGREDTVAAITSLVLDGATRRGRRL